MFYASVFKRHLNQRLKCCSFLFALFMQRECRNENVCNSAYRYISNIEIRRSEFNLKTCYSEFFRKRLLQRTWRSLRVFSELFKITCLICRVPVNSCFWNITYPETSIFILSYPVRSIFCLRKTLSLNMKPEILSLKIS